MKIAVVVGQFPKISETFIVNQILGLLDRGHDVTIFAKEATNEKCQSDVTEFSLLERTHYPSSLARSKWRRIFEFAIDWLALLFANPKQARHGLLLALPFHSRGLQRYYFAKLFVGHSFDLIHCHFGTMGALTASVAEHGWIACPIVTSFHGVDIGANATLNGYQGLVRRGAAYTSNSRYSADRAVALGFPREKIHLLPVGVNLRHFAFKERAYSHEQVLRLLIVGRLVESKGIHIAISAVRRVADSLGQVHLDIVGEGPQRMELEQLIKDSNLDNQVFLHGARLREEVVCFLDKAHMLILPSVGMERQSVGMEGQGLVLQEAQAMGIPVIASRICGIPEGIDENRSGLLFTEGNVEQLAACILKLHSAPSAWPAMGRAGRALVERCFDIDLLNDRLVDIYNFTASGDQERGHSKNSA